MYQEGHEEAQEELPKKAKFFLSTAVQKWDADFFVKVDDNIDLDLGNAFTYSFSFPEHHSQVYSEFYDTSFTLFSGLAEALIGLLERRRGQDGAYIGCMKSGDVISEEYILYYIFFYIKCDCFHP